MRSSPSSVFAGLLTSWTRLGDALLRSHRDRSLESESVHVFADYDGNHTGDFALSLHKKLREDLQPPSDCVIHSMCHTF